MSQVGYTPISLYYSSTAGNTPTAGNLVAGELAINTADGKLFYKDSAGVVQVIGTKGGVGSSSNTQVLYNSSGLVVGSANMTFDGTSLTISSSGNVSAGGLVTTGAGSSSVASIRLVDTGTGFYHPATDTVGVITAGSERMRISSAGYVGITTTTPRTNLEIAGPIAAPTAINTSITGSGAGTLVITNSSNGTIGSVIGTANNGSSYDTYIQARNLGAASTVYNLLLQPLGGYVAIGTSSPASGRNLTLETAGDTVQRISSTGASNGLVIEFTNNGANRGAIGNGSGIITAASASNFGIQASNDLLFASGGYSEKMRLSSAGYLTISNQPSWLTSVTGGQTFSGGWNLVAITNNVTYFDTASGLNLTAGNYKYTAPVAGKYLISFAVTINGSNTDGTLTLYKNGTDLQCGASQAYVSSLSSTNLTYVVNLSAGDYIQAYYYATATVTTRNTAYAGYFSGHLVG